MISVCMATYNGEKYIKRQIESILCQLSESDELIVSDDYSIDNTINIISSFNDSRIKIIYNKKSNKGVIKNFENAISYANGDYIYLSDQDDVWFENKIEIMNKYLRQYDCVICDINLMFEEKIIESSYNKINKSNISYIGVFISNPFVGSAMAFNKKLINKILPFPNDIPMHDLWIGVVAKFIFNLVLLDEVLMSHRLHHLNYSTTGIKSKNSVFTKINYRIKLLINILKLKTKLWIENFLLI